MFLSLRKASSCAHAELNAFQIASLLTLQSNIYIGPFFEALHMILTILVSTFLIGKVQKLWAATHARLLQHPHYHWPSYPLS